MMNLYSVGYYLSSWSCFCFAPTANKAKAMVANHFNEEYPNMRVRTIKKGMCVPYAAVVDDANHELYPKIAEIGLRYKTVEELFEDDPFKDDYLLGGIDNDR